MTFRSASVMVQPVMKPHGAATGTQCGEVRVEFVGGPGAVDTNEDLGGGLAGDLGKCVGRDP